MLRDQLQQLVEKNQQEKNEVAYPLAQNILREDLQPKLLEAAREGEINGTFRFRSVHILHWEATKNVLITLATSEGLKVGAIKSLGSFSTIELSWA